MTSNQTSTQRRRVSIPELIGMGLAALLVYPSLVIGNDFMLNYAASNLGQRWLSEFIEQHWIWANIIYFFVTMAVVALAIPFVILLEKTNRLIFLIPVFLLQIPFLATFVVGIYRTLSILYPFASDLIAAYRLKFPLFVLIVIVAITSSYAAYTVRTFKRIHYGLIELLFGIGSIVFAVYSVVVVPFMATGNTLTDTDVWKAVFGFLTGAYIIVRGLVNIEDGLKQGPLTPRTISGVLVPAFRSKIVQWFGWRLEG
jgi:hypothetical protein